jgi:F-type H+-transporting ATPase subunit alpha
VTEKDLITRALLFCADPPSERHKRQIIDFLKDKYQSDIPLSWVEDKSIKNGFRLEVEKDGQKSVYDWSLEARLNQLKEDLRRLSPSVDNIIPLIKETIRNWTPKAMEQEIGTVLTVGDGIATVKGLPNASYQEILLFSSGIRGMVQELKNDEVGCILFDDGSSIAAGSPVKRTGRTAGIPVGRDFIGRVVDALGNPIDKEEPITADEYRSLESPAPSITDRKPVYRPMETGILAIDSMFPIGHGQRELIIGDRQTGKTSLAVDTILNQKGKDVICIYVAIGQKASTVAQTVHTLRRFGAMEYTTVISASASDPAPLQYIAPYSGCTLGEYFMNKGRSVLIIYDDLTKHAVAYRSLSLLLERSPGREAYPGDIFFLHSRLLERSAQLSDEKGGGSMTALPIVETKAGDISAYIPTNIISITDGQIYLEKDLFFSGQRPAINIGLSVSRVGSNAQTKAMKAAVGSLRLDLAQFQEMEVFMQFAGDLDEMTQKQLSYGQGLMYLLRQEKHEILTLDEQVILLTAALNRVMQDVSPEDVPDFKHGLLEYFEKQASYIPREIEKTRELKPELKEEIVNIARKYANTVWHKAR